MWPALMSAATQDKYICNFRASASLPGTVSIVTDHNIYGICAFIASVLVSMFEMKCNAAVLYKSSQLYHRFLKNL